MMFRSKYPIVWDLLCAFGYLLVFLLCIAGAVGFLLRVLDVWPYL